MQINTEELKKELLKEDVIKRFEDSILERFTISQLKNFTKEEWSLEIIGTLGFSLSSIVVDFLELNKEFFENNTDYRWESYIDEVLNSFINGKYIDPFKNIECELFFDTIEGVVEILKDRLINYEDEFKYC